MASRVVKPALVVTVIHYSFSLPLPAQNSSFHFTHRTDFTDFSCFLFSLACRLVWWSGVVVSTLASINEVNLRRTRLVLRWVTVSGSIPGAGHLFQYVTNQPPKANSAFHSIPPGSVNEYQLYLYLYLQLWYCSARLRWPLAGF